MKKLSLIALAAALAFSSSVPSTFGAASIVQGESAPGVYENISSTSQKLNVNVTGSAAPVTAVTLTTTTPTVTNSSTTILAANTSRKIVLIQNNDVAGNIFLNFTTTATTAHLKLGPGQSLLLSNLVSTDAIRAIGSIASNANVVVVEGQ